MNTRAATVNRGEIVSMYAGLKAYMPGLRHTVWEMNLPLPNV